MEGNGWKEKGCSNLEKFTKPYFASLARSAKQYHSTLGSQQKCILLLEMMRIVWCSFWYTTDLQDFFHCHCQLRAGELNLRSPDRYWGTEVLIGTATGTRSRHTLVSSLIQQGGKSFEGRCKKLNIGWKAEDIWRGFRILNSGDILLWDNRRILGKPIIVLARQAQPTRINQKYYLGDKIECIFIHFWFLLSWEKTNLSVFWSNFITQIVYLINRE